MATGENVPLQNTACNQTQKIGDPLRNGMPKRKYTELSCKPQNIPKSSPSTAWPSPSKAVNMASQTEDTDPGLREQNNFNALMQAIATCQTTLTGKIECMQLDISLIRRDIDCFCSRLTETERRVGEAEDTLQIHGVSLHTLQTKMKTLEAHAEDAENRNRRNNLRIVGLPEGTEGKDPTPFTEHLLRTLLPDAWFSIFFCSGEGTQDACYPGAPRSSSTYIYFKAPELQRL